MDLMQCNALCSGGTQGHATHRQAPRYEDKQDKQHKNDHDRALVNGRSRVLAYLRPIQCIADATVLGLYREPSPILRLSLRMGVDYRIPGYITNHCTWSREKFLQKINGLLLQ